MTKEELGNALAGMGYEYVIKGATFVVMTTDDRTATLQAINKAIKGSIFVKVSSRSSKGEIKVTGLSIIVKAPTGGSSGSGAGAYITALAESAQCYYCAAAWYGGDFTDATLRKTAKYCDTPGVTVEQVIKELPDNWIESCSKTATSLYSKFSGGKFSFHRGSSFVGGVSSTFNRINKVYKEFPNINKWSPADIYMVSSKGVDESLDYETFDTFNNFLLKKIKSKDIVGVSLKQTKVAYVKEMNFTKNRNSNTYKGWTLGKRSYFDSKDVYILYDDGEIQFRGFPTWQGEIKGKTANHGKISGGPVKSLVQKLTRKNINTQQEILGKIKRKDAKFYSEWFSYVNALQKGYKKDAFIEQAASMDPFWQSSKFLGTQLIYVMEESGKQQQILSAMINYASSQSDLSAPYIKVE
jgi:hypothetical protein